MSNEERSRLLCASARAAEAAAHLLLVPGLYQATAEVFIRHSRELAAFAHEMGPKLGPSEPPIGSFDLSRGCDGLEHLHEVGDYPRDCQKCREHYFAHLPATVRAAANAEDVALGKKPAYEAPKLERVEWCGGSWPSNPHAAGSRRDCEACIDTRKSRVKREPEPEMCQGVGMHPHIAGSDRNCAKCFQTRKAQAVR